MNKARGMWGFACPTFDVLRLPLTLGILGFIHAAEIFAVRVRDGSQCERAALLSFGYC
jgi:hypothetical protein